MDDPVLFKTNASRAASAIGECRRQAGFHCLVRGSNLRTRIFPVSPRILTTYCRSRRPRRYKLPDDELPRGVKVRMLLERGRMGPWPGGVRPGSPGESR